MSAEKTPAQLLRKGADYIAKHGLCKDGSYGAVGAPCCSMGAVGVVYGDGHDDSPEICEYANPDEPIMKSLDAMTAAVGVDVREWNDEPGRTAEQVIAKMREVADLLDAQAVAS